MLQANHSPELLQNWMQEALFQAHSISWNYAIRQIADKVLAQLLGDKGLHGVVRNFLEEGSKKPFDFYFINHLGSARPDGEPERSLFLEYQRLKNEALAPLRQIGLKEPEVRHYEIIGFLTSEQYRSESIPIQSLLVHNYLEGYLQLTQDICTKYGLDAEAEMLRGTQQCMAAYLKYRKGQ